MNISKIDGLLRNQITLSINIISAINKCIWGEYDTADILESLVSCESVWIQISFGLCASDGDVN